MNYIQFRRAIFVIAVATLLTSVIALLIAGFFPGPDYQSMGALATIFPALSGVIIAAVAVYAYLKTEDNVLRQAQELRDFHFKIRNTLIEFARIVQVTIAFGDSQYYKYAVTTLIEPVLKHGFEMSYPLIIAHTARLGSDGIEQARQLWTSMLVGVTFATSQDFATETTAVPGLENINDALEFFGNLKSVTAEEVYLTIRMLHDQQREPIAGVEFEQQG